MGPKDASATTEQAISPRRLFDFLPRKLECSKAATQAPSDSFPIDL
jgi:hypothetical protein